jgi:hypothetical protein
MEQRNNRRVGGLPTLFHLDRRALLKAAAAGAASLLLAAHTPYGQWTVYRQRNLFIVASRTDEAALILARAIVEGFATELPESRARVTRATDPVRIASLLATGQLDVAVVSRAEAAAMRAGSGDFRAVGAVAVNSLAELGAHLMVTLDSFKPRHAYLLALSVDHLRQKLPILAASASDASALPLHPGAAAYYNGLPAP